MHSTYKTSFEETEVHPDNYIAGVRIHTVQMSRGSIVRAFTQDGEVGRGQGVVAGAGGGGPAEVDAAVMGLHVGDHQVAAAQHLGVVHVDGLAVGAAPRDDWLGVAGGDALQDHRLMHGHRDVLGGGNDSGPLAGFRGCTWSLKKKKVKKEDN